MGRDDRANAGALGDLASTVRVGLEPLGSDILVEGELRELSANEMVVATVSMLAAGTRAFLVIEDSGRAPLVGLVEVVDQQIVIDDVMVELRARIVRMSDADADSSRPPSSTDEGPALNVSLMVSAT